MILVLKYQNCQKLINCFCNFMQNNPSQNINYRNCRKIPETSLFFVISTSNVTKKKTPVFFCWTRLNA